MGESNEVKREDEEWDELRRGLLRLKKCQSHNPGSRYTQNTQGCYLISHYHVRNNTMNSKEISFSYDIINLIFSINIGIVEAYLLEERG